jgi:TRAP-type C4-dicarboxylate transport system substrate-binding protein
MPGEGLTRLADSLAARTHGQIQLTPAFDGPDGLRSATIPGAVQAGKLTIGDAFAGGLGEMDPVFQISSLPFLATDLKQAWALYQKARPAYADAFAKHGQRLLYATPWPASGIWSRNAVPDPTALKGLSIRTYDGTSTGLFNALGAAATQISFADAMPKLKDSSLSAVLSSGDGGAGRKLWLFLPHFTEIGYAMPLSFTTINQLAYDALSPGLKQAVDAAAAETEAGQWAALQNRTAENQSVMRANGVSIDPASPALATALRAASTTAITDWKHLVTPAIAELAKP